MYWKPNNWKIISRKTCRFYDSNETPFEAICVQIGYNKNAPVIRWISAKEYNYYVEENR